MKGDEASFCTIELSSGTRMAVACKPAQMTQRIQRVIEPDTMMWLRIETMRERPSAVDSVYRNPVHVRRESVVAIFPLDAHRDL